MKINLVRNEIEKILEKIKVKIIQFTINLMIY